jgi:hypothetical protein
LDVDITSGPFLVVVTILAAAGAIYLAVRKSWRWLLVVVALCAGGVSLSYLTSWLMVYVWQMFPEDLPRRVILWGAVGYVATLLAIAGLIHSTILRKVVSGASALTVLLFVVVQVLGYYGIDYTVGDVFGLRRYEIQALAPSPFKGPTHRDIASAPSDPAYSHWAPPTGLPANGQLKSAPIPGGASKFASRDAVVYLPPAYLLPDRPKLPVLVLISGQPGSPEDWIVGGRVDVTMDRFAAQHGGLAPVVVVPDPNGQLAGNTLCMDSKIAAADTFMSVDVPAWIAANLDVDSDRHHWAVGAGLASPGYLSDVP